MFNWLFKKNQNKEYVSCKWLEYGIHFTASGLHTCDKYAHPESSMTSLSPLGKNNNYNFSDFFKKKKKLRRDAKKGKIQSTCQGCYMLENTIWEDAEKIKCMAISTNTSCNSNCIYCYTHRNKKFYNSQPDISIYDFIEKSIKNKKIESDCEIQIGGGEPLLKPEFEKIIKIFLDNSFNNIRIYSSGILYSLGIQKCLEKDYIKELVISVDSGTQELYKSIKNVDEFESVWKNIKSYCDSQGENKEQVRAKYIIIPKLNENIAAIDAFFDKVLESGVKFVLIDVEMFWYKTHHNNKKKIQELFNIVKYMEAKCIENNIKFGHFSSVCYAIDKYRKMYEETNVCLGNM